MQNKKLLIFWFILSLLFSILLYRSWFWENDVLYVSSFATWIDWTSHLALVHWMKYRNIFDWFTESYLIVDRYNVYPFIADIPIVLLLRLGLPLKIAFLAPFAIYFSFMIFFLLRLLQTILKNENKTILSTLLFLLSGGFGFFSFFKDFYQDPNFIFQNHQNEYTYILNTPNVITGQLLANPGLLLGFGIFCIIFCLLINFIESQQSTKINNCIFTFLVSALFLIHPHSAFIFAIIVTLIIAVSFCYKKPILNLIKFILPSFISLFLIFVFVFFNKFENTSQFFSPFWFISGFKYDYISYWLINTGVTYPLAAWSYYKMRKKRSWIEFLLLISALSLLIIYQTMIFQPNPWDNIKYLFYVQIFASCLIANYLLEFSCKKIMGKISLITIITVLTLSGVIDIANVFIQNKISYPLFTKDDFLMAEKFISISSPTDRYIANNQHNNWTILTGRQPIMGYQFFLKCDGINTDELQSKLTQISVGDDNSKKLINELNVKYLILNDGIRYTSKERKRHIDYFQSFYKVPKFNIKHFKSEYKTIIENSYDHIIMIE
jgi:hypothetical protein